MVLLHSYSYRGSQLDQANLMAQPALGVEMRAAYAAADVHAEQAVQSHQTV